ncbi:two-component system lateral flagellar response regulator [Oceanimonas sp. GK1]|uniref:sigma-54 interaction domain-containing protein n=1 Tax=Oceanimonas sp. (strain GK1 / IBRC-M 10197) TaxID=511062 RepID=UPI000249569A|nr:sigma-54 dependent transcriptional regulator [Oceanimonas sp. GK1]AEY02569.1 two-component system lateral flagellar response regulator [Oceanimonas sp. GK1]
MNMGTQSSSLLWLISTGGLSDVCHGALLAEGYRIEPMTVLSRSEHKPGVILVDSDTGPGFAGHIQTLVSRFPQAVILAMVEHGESALAGEALRAGASDYVLKPFQPSQLLRVLGQSLALRHSTGDMVVRSRAGLQVLQLAYRAAQTPAAVLIGGESGTGKECLARYIHQVSDRRDGPFVAVNCAAIPESMLEAVLFGYSKGAYTGAAQAQAGKFELANGGTLLLDEIAEMPLGLQAKLLRVLQEREVERLGSHQKVRLNVRIVAASNKDLREAVSAGEFREDLFYRLDVLPLGWPPLRERVEDIMPLARHFLHKYGEGESFRFSADAERALLGHPWPGNIRELENVIQRALILARSAIIDVADLMLPGAARPANSLITLSQPAAEPAAEGLQASRQRAEFDYVLQVLRRHSGHRSRTAEALGLTTRALRYKLAAMREQGIDIDRATGA